MSLDCKKPKVCTPTPEPPPHPPTPPFEVCIAMDYKLTWDGTHATLERVTTTPDGSYTMFNVVNGCIVNPGVGDIPTYTPPYCNPNPGDCQQGGGAGGMVNISHQAGNIIVNNGDGLYARCYVQAGPGIVVVGVGTVYDPYVISGGASGGGIVNVVGRDGINATVDENKVAYVGMTPTGVTPGTFRGLTTTPIWMAQASVQVAGWRATTSRTYWLSNIRRSKFQAVSTSAAGGFLTTIPGICSRHNSLLPP